MTYAIEREPPATRQPLPPLVQDELTRVAAALCAQFPDHDPAELTEVVNTAYRQLSADATVTTHLIALTINRCHRILAGTRPG